MRLSALIRHQADFIGVGEKTISDTAGKAHVHAETNKQTNTLTGPFADFYNSLFFMKFTCFV